MNTVVLRRNYLKHTVEDGIPKVATIIVGSYKTIPNKRTTDTGEELYYKSPEETPELMEGLVKWYNEEVQKKDINPITFATNFHHKFIEIHPFGDGNGRVGRLLMNLALMTFDYPPAIFKKDDRDNYISALRLADSGNIEPFVEYVAKSVVSSLELIFKVINGEDIEEPDDFDKKLSILQAKMTQR